MLANRRRSPVLLCAPALSKALFLPASMSYGSGMEIPSTWKKCSSCKKEIPFSTMYYLCSVSTCRHKRTGFRFCSVPCWDAHLGYANHRSSFAEEARSPTQQEYYAELQSEAGEKPAPRRIIVGDQKPASSQPSSSPAAQPAVETLVVVSRVKSLISDLSGFNTSQCCIDALVDKIAGECRNAIEKARAAGRKTVMGRDVR